MIGRDHATIFRPVFSPGPTSHPSAMLFASSSGAFFPSSLRPAPSDAGSSTPSEAPLLFRAETSFEPAPEEDPTRESVGLSAACPVSSSSRESPLVAPPSPGEVFSARARTAGAHRGTRRPLSRAAEMTGRSTSEEIVTSRGATSVPAFSVAPSAEFGGALAPGRAATTSEGCGAASPTLGAASGATFSAPSPGFEPPSLEATDFGSGR